MLQVIFSLGTLWWMILFLYIPACFGLIIIVLLQKGKGTGLAGAFGMGGGMDTIFGPRSSKSLPQKITYASAAIFMSLALIMSILSGRVGRASAPELLADTPQVATMDALFDPSAAVMDPISVPVTDEGEAADAEESDAVVAPEPTTMDTLFEVTTEAIDPEEDAEDVAETVEAAPEEEAVAVEPEVEAAAVEDAHEEPVVDAPSEDAPAE